MLIFVHTALRIINKLNHTDHHGYKKEKRKRKKQKKKKKEKEKEKREEKKLVQNESSTK